MPAKSKSQQRFFGMVRAAQKGEGASSPEVAKVADEISDKDAKKFAKTKHKGLPEKKKQEESFEIDKSAHKAAQKKTKMRNLARGNKNPNEKAAAEKKAGGPKLVGEGVMDIVRKYNKKKEAKKPQKAQDAGARARRVLQRKEYKSKVSSIVPSELEDHKNWSDFKNNLSI